MATKNNRKRAVPIILIVIGVILLCGSALIMLSNMQPNNISYAQLEKGGSISWDPKSYTVSLEENGTTGYRWVFDGDEPVDDDFTEPNSEGSVGAPGIRKVKFEPKESYTLTCRYQRSWEQDKPAKELKLKIVVENNYIKEITEIPSN